MTPDIESVLAEHRLSNVVCTCMAWSASWGDDRPAIEAGHRAHVAEALAPVLAAAVRDAEQRAWDEGKRAGISVGESGTEAGTDRHLRRVANPYRADRVAVDAPEGGEGR